MDGPHAPVKSIGLRLASLGYYNPCMMAVSQASEFIAIFCDGTKGLEPGVLQHDMMVHTWNRLLAKAQQELRESDGMPTAPVVAETLGGSSVTGDKLALAIEHLASVQTKHKKDGVLREQVDSDEEDFDLASFLSKDPPAPFPTKDIPGDWFASSYRLGRLNKHFVKAKAKASSQASHLLSDTGIEEWIPSWVGASLEPYRKTRLLKDWKQHLQVAKSPEHFLSTVASYWMSQAAVGIIPCSSVFVHMLLLLKMMCEHDLLYAIRYERRLQVTILLHIKTSGSKGPPALFQRLCGVMAVF